MITLLNGRTLSAVWALPLFSLLVPVLAAQTAVADEDLRKADANNWLSYSGSYHAQRHTALKQINASTAPNLTARWMYHMPGPGQLEAVPVVVSGIMYVAQANAVRALDAATGRLVWEYLRPAPPRGKNRGLAIF